MHSVKSKKPSDKRLLAFLNTHDKNNEEKTLFYLSNVKEKRLEGECRHSYKRENKHNKSSRDRSRDGLEYGVLTINKDREKTI